MAPDDPTDTGGTTSPGLIDRLGTGGVVGVIAGAVVGLAVLTSVLGSDEPPVETVPVTQPPQAAPPTTLAGPQVPPIDGCSVLPDDEIDEALGLIDEDGSFRPSELTAFGIREGCRWEATIDETGDTVAIELGPGDHEDFAPDSTALGVSSVPVDSVGDLAVWYPGEGVGMLSAVEHTPNGLLFVRLGIERPEIDDTSRRALAESLVNSAIERIRFGPPPPIEADLCALITDEDAERLLAPHREGRPGARDEVFGGGSPKVVDLSEPGETFCQKLISTEIYLTAAMAVESDFGPDARIDGVSGETITGIGAEAVWFEGVPGTGSFAAPHDTDILAVRSGDAMFRIVIALPDLDRAERLVAASELARIGLTKLPGADQTEIVVEQLEEPDLSDVGFVENLFAKVDRGAWTIGEGLVSTLELFTGERDPADVLLGDDLSDRSGTEVVRMARSYVDEGPDAEVRAELDRLLDLLSISTLDRVDPVQDGEAAIELVVDRGVLDGATGRSVAAFSPMYRLALQEEEEEELQDPAGPEDEEDEGYAPPPDFPDEDQGYAPPPDFPDDEPYLPPHEDPWGVGECGNASGEGWTAVPAYFGQDVGPFKAQIVYPATGFTTGWGEQHLIWATEAVQDSLDTFNAASAPCLQIVLSVHGGSSSYVLDTNDAGTCGIFLNTPLQTREEAPFKQEIARDIAHCIIPVNWPDQVEVASFSNRLWWNGALAEFLSNVVYPAPMCAGGRCDLEWRLAGTMQAQEPTVPMMHRQDANWMFFQHLWWQSGLQGVIGLVDQIPANNDTIQHEITISGVDGMREIYHGFVETLSDAGVQDSGGGSIPYTPPSEPIDVSGERSITREPEPFGMKRLHVTVDPGKFGCFESTAGDDVMLTYRPGSPGSGGSGWQEFPTDETVLSGEMVVVATTTEPNGTFTIEVTDVNDDGECQEEEEPSDPEQVDVPCLAECGPSSYYQYLHMLAEWFQAVFEAMAPDPEGSLADVEPVVQSVRPHGT